MGKGEIARNEQFLLFPQFFQPNQINVHLSAHIFYIISLFAAAFEEPKNGISGKGLNDLSTAITCNGVSLLLYDGDERNTERVSA